MKTVHLIILLSGICLASCQFGEDENVVNTHGPDSVIVQNNDSVSDDDIHKHITKELLTPDKKVQKLVLNLPEVKRTCRALDSARKSKNNIESVIEQSPNADDPYYSIIIKDKQGKQNDKLFQFFVDPTTNQIKIYDAGEDRLLSLTEWRKMQNP
jgi:hypothetical protein